MLIVDDSPYNLFVLEHLLTQIEQVGFVEKAVNGQDAIYVVEEAIKNEQSFDVIILDLHMPICDGFRAAGVIRGLIKDTNMRHCDIYGLSAIT